MNFVPCAHGLRYLVCTPYNLAYLGRQLGDPTPHSSFSACVHKMLRGAVQCGMLERAGMIPQEDTEWGLGSRSEIGRKAICDLPRGALTWFPGPDRRQSALSTATHTDRGVNPSIPNF